MLDNELSIRQTDMTLLKKVGPTIMSANVVQFNVATQLDNNSNFMDFVRRYMTLCNALTGHFSRIHNACNLLSQS